MMKKAVFLLGAVALLALSFTGWGWTEYRHFLRQPLDVPPGGAVLNVEPGMSARAVVTRVAEHGLTRSDWRWRVLLRSHPVVLQAGEYRLEPGITPAGLLGMMERGEVIHYRFTIVEGWTYRQLLEALTTNEILGNSLPGDPGAGIRIDTAMSADSMEGLFLPETYLYTRSDTATDVMQRAADAMAVAVTEAWEMRLPGHPVKSPYELLILASIIEKETALDAERARISGVFVRRLERGMRLQTDPTVIYGLGDSFDGDIRRADLVNDTPYNTYTRAGLPPTPIAMPGWASLVAAALPEPGDALYFVADGEGGHTFSATLEEHQLGVDKLTGKN